METLSHNPRRKKRKTRKCLDDIRKRSRNNISAVNDLPGQKVLHNNGSIIICNPGKRINNNCITSKRLTLKMFAKAVRSETITRPLLCEEKRGLEVNIKTPVTLLSSVLVDSKSSNSPKLCDNDTDNFVEEKALGKSLTLDEDSSDSLTWFSPTRRPRSHRLLESGKEDTTSTETSPSRSNEDFGYHLYEELLEDIPLYARRNLSNFINYDITKKTTTCLQSLQIDYFHQNHDNVEIDIIPSIHHSTLQASDSSFTTPKEIIVQDPRNYIKIGCRQGLSPSAESTPSAAGASPALSPPSSSPFVDTQIASITYTPDYNFYPHRLNE